MEFFYILNRLGLSLAFVDILSVDLSEGEIAELSKHIV